MTLRITALRIYPLKSCRGISLNEAALLASGLEHDREMMIVDSQGHFVTQRGDAVLATIAVALAGHSVTISCQGHSVTFNKQYTQAVNATVWRRQLPAFDQGDRAADFLTEVIGRPVRLVATRPSATLHADKTILFQDGQALHLIGAGSLLHAQTQLPDYQIDARRFRPNIIVDDDEGELPAFAEDNWQTINTPSAVLRMDKPCERCNIPAINPDNLNSEQAVQDYLLKYRKINKRILFGVCGYGVKLGRLRIGDCLTVVKRG